MVVLITAGFGMSAGWAADPASLSEAQQQYQAERAKCMAQTTSDRAACLESAGAALEEAKRGRLDTAPHAYDQNQFARCYSLPLAQRDECQRRLRMGMTTGSVQGGGVLRELTTPVPAPAASPAPAPSISQPAATAP